MTLLLTLLILAVVGLVAAVAVGRITGGLDEPASSLPGRGLPAGRVGPADLDRVRFSPALRGYRMDEVDDVLDRLTEELRNRDEELAELRGGAAARRSPAEELQEQDDDLAAELPWADRQDPRETNGSGGWRRSARGAYPEPFTPPPGIPAAPPSTTRDELGKGR